MPTVPIPSYTSVDISIDLSDHLDEMEIELDSDAILELLDEEVGDDELAQHLAQDGSLSRVLSHLDEEQLKDAMESQTELFKLALVSIGAIQVTEPPTLAELAGAAVTQMRVKEVEGSSSSNFPPCVAATEQIREAAKLLASYPDSRAILQEAVTAAHVTQQMTAWLNDASDGLIPTEAEAAARAATTEAGTNGTAPPDPQEGAAQ